MLKRNHFALLDFNMQSFKNNIIKLRFELYLS